MARINWTQYNNNCKLCGEGKRERKRERGNSKPHNKRMQQKRPERVQE